MKFLKDHGRKMGIAIVGMLMVMLLLFPLWGRIFLPAKLFSDPYSTIVYDRYHQLLGARIAGDGQWRFPEPDSLPVKYKTAVIQFEDKNFYRHPGFNPFSLAEATLENIKAGKIVRGGSTITMQVIRLFRKQKKRTIKEKIIEILLATALEQRYSKEEILQLYAAHAPFGGNVVGIEAASWRWFGHPPDRMSWAEAATLAVLPNAPSLIHPGKNRKKLLQKRNHLLKNLFLSGSLDTLHYQLAILEKIPDKPKKLPQTAPHLTDFFQQQNKGRRIVTTLDKNLQQSVNAIVKEYYTKYSANEIRNMAVLVLRTDTKEVLAYVGNTGNGISQKQGQAVDMIHVRRSTGSILKPLLYAAAIEDGQILINSLIPDIPSYFQNYHPQNYDNTFEGAIPASQALSRSRNVPAIYLLRDYGTARFLDLLHQTGISDFDKPADYYGLSMILGGGEASLWNITNMYAGMAQSLLHYNMFYGKYTGKEYAPPVLLLKNQRVPKEPAASQWVPIHAGAIWETWHALYKVHRPQEEEGWEFFSNSNQIAWKTGTSFGFRDAWAVGSTADFVVGVWVGNADGEGRFGLTGVSSAAPVMFDVFDKLPLTNHFQAPEDDLIPIAVCKKSGFRASPNCPEIDTVLSYKKGVEVKQCPYHHKIFTDLSEHYQLHRGCGARREMKAVSWFVLPPVQEWYYRKAHPGYKLLPPFRSDCQNSQTASPMQFVYPQNGEKIFVTKGVTGKREPIVFELTHHHPATKIYWNLDKQYVGMTQNNHHLAFIPLPGKHTLTVVDQQGKSLSIKFEILGKKE